MERRKERRTWIKFGALSLQILLEGIESCCKTSEVKKGVSRWKEVDRRFYLDLRSNEAGKYVQCTVWDSEEKRYSLIFPERKQFGGRMEVAWE